jgi:hypothetical protein
MPSIHTTRYSKVVRAFVERYPDAEVTLDKKQILVGEALWCKNAVLLNAIDFSICRGNVELLSFHDGPQNMWAHTETLPLVKELAAQKILRYTEQPTNAPAMITRLFALVRKFFPEVP